MQVAVYDVLGREVARLVNGSLDAGWHEVQWDGRNDRGATVSSGVYLLRVQAGTKAQVHLMTMLK